MLSERYLEIDGVEEEDGVRVGTDITDEVRKLEAELKQSVDDGVQSATDCHAAEARIVELEKQLESYNKYANDGQAVEGPQYWQDRIDSQDRHIRKLEGTVADQRISIMALEDAISEVWEERVRKLEAVVALAQHEDYGIDHAYFCNSTHDTGLPCDCELGPALTDLEDGK